MDIQGQAASITCDASGLGEATARELVRCGARVALIDVSAELAHQTAATINAEFGVDRAKACPCDITNTEGAKPAMAAAAAAHGPARILATSCPTRSHFTPDVLRFVEQGFGELTAEEWFGFCAPARTPTSVVDAANAAISAALKAPSVISSLGTFGLVAQGSSVREMDRSQRDAYFGWGPLVRSIGFTGQS